MNGVHDMGGMHGFGPVVPEPNEPVFHAVWEGRTFALALATLGSRRFNTDEFRRTIERMSPARYLASSYYERWLHAIEALLLEKQIVRGGEIDARTHDHIEALQKSTTPIELAADETSTVRPGRATTLRYDSKFKARFEKDDRVIVRNLNPEGHTRVPRYIRGHRGVIRHDWGTFVFPDTHAHGAGANPQHCYGVEFSARELWGTSHAARERIYVDLWEAYLAPDEAVGGPRKPGLNKSKVTRPTAVRVARKRATAAKTRTRKEASKRR
jgi:nitrile hydratase